MSSTATLSGAVLSSLLYEHANCAGDQEGLLLGKVSSHVSDTISDSQINNVKVETSIFIYRFCAFTKPDSFHGKDCQILQEKLQSAIPRGYKLVGWFHSRRNASPRISLREKNVHRNLLNILPAESREHFVFLFFNTFNSENLSTHTIEYNFYQYSSTTKRFTRIPVTVSNLGDTTHTEYHTEETSTVNTETGIFASIVAKHEQSLLDSDGFPLEVQKVKSLADSLQAELKTLTVKLCESEMQRSKLEEEIREKKLIIAQKTEEKRAVARMKEVASGGGGLNMKEVASGDSGLSMKEVVSGDAEKRQQTYEDSVNIAKQKREARRRDAASKASLGLRQKGHGKNKLDVSGSHHPRRLSSDEYYEKDLISLDDGVENSDKTESMDSSSTKEESDDKIKQKKDALKMEFSFTSSSQESEINIPYIDASTADEETEEETKPEDVQKQSKNSDHFSFIENMLQEAKSKPNTRAKKGVQSSTVERKISENKQGVRKDLNVSEQVENQRTTRSTPHRNQGNNSRMVTSEGTGRTYSKKANGSKCDSDVPESHTVKHSVDFVNENPVMLKDCRIEASSIGMGENSLHSSEENGVLHEDEKQDMKISSSPVF